jgi:hypothetical protein
MPDDRPYAVGYRKPPQKTRFRKGSSGNPNGRPKGSNNLATVLERELQRKVVIREYGQRKTITKLEAALTQLTNKSASGDLVAIKLLIALVRSAEESPVSESERERGGLRESDEKVMAGILRRFERIAKGDPSAPKSE